MPTPKKILTTPLRISIAFLLLGMLFQIAEWPYATEIILCAFASIGILYPFRFWKKSGKRFLDYIKLILDIFWSVNGIFRALDFAYTLFFQIVIAISFVIWIILEGTAYFLDEDRKNKNTRSQVLWNFAMVVGTLAIIAGSLLNILNWQFAIPLMVFGVTIIVAYILKDIFAPKSLEEKDRNNEEYQV
jgi:membrane protein implicated in regulation of membrane protease activity